MILFIIDYKCCWKNELIENALISFPKQVDFESSKFMIQTYFYIQHLYT